MNKNIRYEVRVLHYDLDKIVKWVNAQEPERFCIEIIKTDHREIGEEKYKRLLDEYAKKSDKVDEDKKLGNKFYYTDFNRNIMTEIQFCEIKSLD